MVIEIEIYNGYVKFVYADGKKLIVSENDANKLIETNPNIKMTIC